MSLRFLILKMRPTIQYLTLLSVSGVLTGLVCQNDRVLTYSGRACAVLVVAGLIDALIIRYKLKRSERNIETRIAELDRILDASGRILVEEYLRFREESGQGNLGNPACIYNARSKYLRCTPNPDGPCTGCTYFTSELHSEAQESK